MDFKEYFITGSTSFIGNNLVKFLLLNNKNVTILTRNKKKISKYSWEKKVNIKLFNLNDKLYNFPKINQKSILIHLAWDHLPNYNSDNHIQNALNSFRLICDANKKGIKDIFVSGTCFEYGYVNGPINSNIECNPTNIYAFSKHMLHTKLIINQNKNNINLKWGRIFYPYGEGQYSGIIASLDKAINNKEPYFNMSSGNQIKDFVEIKSVVKQIYKIIHKKNNGTFNICSGKGTKVIDLVKKWKIFRKSKIKLNRGYYKVKKEEDNNFWGIK